MSCGHNRPSRILRIAARGRRRSGVEAVEAGKLESEARASRPRRTVQVAVLYPCDPFGHIPSGIDSFIRGLLKWAPPDLSYTLFGATSDPAARPVGQEVVGTLGQREVRSVPIVSVDPTGTRKCVPLTLRYMLALRRYLRKGALEAFDVLDFHRIEPISLFLRDSRPKNVVIHQDMKSLRNAKSDIMWRHVPWLYEILEKRLLPRVDRVFCVRQSAVERYVSSDSSLKGKVFFIPTWMDTTIFTSADESAESSAQSAAGVLRELRLPETARVMISIGRLDYQKDPLLLIEAFRIVLRTWPNAYLLLVGDGSLRSKVENVCASHGLQHRVRILGAQPPARIAQLLRASDLFVLASAYEGMPIAVLEALATGVPVVSTDVGEVRLAVRDGENGKIARERTPRALADAISAALEQTDALRGPACTWSVEAFTPELVLARLYENHRRQARGVLDEHS